MKIIQIRDAYNKGLTFIEEIIRRIMSKSYMEFLGEDAVDWSTSGNCDRDQGNCIGRDQKRGSS